jgi:hypothetical protein
VTDALPPHHVTAECDCAACVRERDAIERMLIDFSMEAHDAGTEVSQ